MGSMGMYICDSSADAVNSAGKILSIEKADKYFKSIEATEKNRHIPKGILKAFKFGIGVFVMILSSNYMVFRWYRFFLLDNNHQHFQIAEQFLIPLTRTRKSLPFRRHFYRRATRLKQQYLINADVVKKLEQNLKKSSLKSEPDTVKLYLMVLTSDYQKFVEFSDLLKEEGVIDDSIAFCKIFQGFTGQQVTWYRDKASIVFMIDLLICEQKIRCVGRASKIAICFFNGIENKVFDPDSLNKEVSNAKISNLNKESLPQIRKEIRNGKRTGDLVKILAIFDQIYR